MAKRDLVETVGLSPYERDQLRGMVYLLVNLRAISLHECHVAVLSHPTQGIRATGTDPTTWHHYMEHYWDDSGNWEIIPFILDEPREWKRAEWEEGRQKRKAWFTGGFRKLKEDVSET